MADTTVEDLIKKLQTLNPKLKVVIGDINFFPSEENVLLTNAFEGGVAMSVKGCKTCEFGYKEHYTAAHEVIDVGLYCPLCHFSGPSCSHLFREVDADSIECNSCHNYIFYPNEDNTFWKDEIYFYQNNKEYCLIRDFMNNQSFLLVENKKVFEVPSILLFDDSEKLFDKLKAYVIFS